MLEIVSHEDSNSSFQEGIITKRTYIQQQTKRTQLPRQQ